MTWLPISASPLICSCGWSVRWTGRGCGPANVTLICTSTSISYGEVFTSSDRPHRAVRFTQGDARQPLSIKAIDLFTVLTRLVDLEPTQSEVLERILANPMLSMADLSAVGVRWPTSKKDRKPHYSLSSRGMTSSADNQPTLDL